MIHIGKKKRRTKEWTGDCRSMVIKSVKFQQESPKEHKI